MTSTPKADLLPCPFCGSTNIDPEGWVAQNPDGSDRQTGPACDDCVASAQSVEQWNTRALKSLLLAQPTREMLAHLIATETDAVINYAHALEIADAIIKLYTPKDAT